MYRPTHARTPRSAAAGDYGVTRRKLPSAGDHRRAEQPYRYSQVGMPSGGIGTAGPTRPTGVRVALQCRGNSEVAAEPVRDAALSPRVHGLVDATSPVCGDGPSMRRRSARWHSAPRASMGGGRWWLLGRRLAGDPVLCHPGVIRASRRADDRPGSPGRWSATGQDGGGSWWCCQVSRAAPGQPGAGREVSAGGGCCRWSR